MHDAGSIFKDSRDDTNVFSKNILGYIQHMHLHWH